MPRRVAKIWAAAAPIALALASWTASAQQTDFELERVQLNTSGAGASTVWDGTLLGDGDMRFGAVARYANSPLVLHRRDGFPIGTLVKNRASADLTFATAVMPWIELGAQLPIVFLSSGADVAGLTSPTERGLGTPWVTARASLLSRTRELPINLGAELGVGLPVGPSGLYANAKSAMVAPKLSLGFKVGQIDGAFELNAVIRPTASLQSYTGSVYDQVTTTWGAAIGMTTSGTGTRAELTARYNRNLMAPGWGAELTAGLRLPTAPTGPELFVAAGPGVGTLLGQPAFRILAGFAFGGPERSLPGPRWKPRPVLPARAAAKPAAPAESSVAKAPTTAPKAVIAPTLSDAPKLEKAAAVGTTKLAMASKPATPSKPATAPKPKAKAKAKAKAAKAKLAKASKVHKADRRVGRTGRLSPHSRTP